MGVQFLLDGINLQAEDTASPYSVSWDTTTSSNGSHTLTARARDAAGNTITSSGVTITVNNVITPPPSGGVDADFQARCTAAGVIKCIGFDSASDFVSGSTIFPADDGQIHAIRDTSVLASGNSSLRFDILSNSSSDTSGYYKGSFGQDFGPGQDFYIQWRQRFSPEMITTNFTGSNGFKQHIIWHGIGGSCTDVQLVTQNIEQRGFPQMYTACGGRGAWIQDPDGDFQLEFGAPPPTGGPGTGGYWCTNRMDQSGENNCAKYTANEWITYYYHVRVGSWGAANTTLEAWAQYGTGPMRKWISLNNFTIDNDSPSSKKFRQIDLLPYQTGKSSSQVHPTAYTWYDELIVSTQPIAAPGATPPPTDTTAPTVSMTAPTSGSIVSGATVTVSATASDNIGVSGVQFLLDGSNLGTEDTTSPHSITWNTTTATNGSHTLTARARDAAGNTTTSSSVTITVDNGPLLGDLNGDRTVNNFDWNIMAGVWFTNDPVADINNDTIVNTADFYFIYTNWNVTQ